MTFADLLADIVVRLDQSGVPYMVTGSLASSYYGEPRSIAKLEWASLSDSDRQRRDVMAIVNVVRTLDAAYIDRWVARLGLTGQWQAVRDVTGEGDAR